MMSANTSAPAATPAPTSTTAAPSSHVHDRHAVSPYNHSAPQATAPATTAGGDTNTPYTGAYAASASTPRSPAASALRIEGQTVTPTDDYSTALRDFVQWFRGTISPYTVEYDNNKSLSSSTVKGICARCFVQLPIGVRLDESDVTVFATDVESACTQLSQLLLQRIFVKSRHVDDALYAARRKNLSMAERDPASAHPHPHRQQHHSGQKRTADQSEISATTNDDERSNKRYSYSRSRSPSMAQAAVSATGEQPQERRDASTSESATTAHAAGSTTPPSATLHLPKKALAYDLLPSNPWYEQNQSQGKGPYVIHMKSLPLDARESDVSQYFLGIPIHKIWLNASIGEAYVEVSYLNDALKALNDKANKQLFKREHRIDMNPVPRSALPNLNPAASRLHSRAEVCKNFIYKGKCDRGQNCKYGHSLDEMINASNPSTIALFQDAAIKRRRYQSHQQGETPVDGDRSYHSNANPYPNDRRDVRYQNDEPRYGNRYGRGAPKFDYSKGRFHPENMAYIQTHGEPPPAAQAPALPPLSSAPIPPQGAQPPNVPYYQAPYPSAAPYHASPYGATPSSAPYPSQPYMHEPSPYPQQPYNAPLQPTTAAGAGTGAGVDASSVAASLAALQGLSKQLQSRKQPTPQPPSVPSTLPNTSSSISGPTSTSTSTFPTAAPNNEPQQSYYGAPHSNPYLYPVPYQYQQPNPYTVPSTTPNTAPAYSGQSYAYAQGQEQGQQQSQPQPPSQTQYSYQPQYQRPPA